MSAPLPKRVPSPSSHEDSKPRMAQKFIRVALSTGSTEHFWSLAAAGDAGLDRLLMVALQSDHPKQLRARAFLAALSMAGSHPNYFRVTLKKTEKFVSMRSQLEPSFFCLAWDACHEMREHGMIAAQIIGQSDHEGRNIEMKKRIRGKPEHKQWANGLLKCISYVIEACALEKPLTI